MEATTRNCTSIFPHIQQQTNSVDCEIFAIANAVQFFLSYYHGNYLIKYDTTFMRDRLLHCLEQERFSSFPRVEKKEKGKPILKGSMRLQMSFAKLDGGDGWVWCNAATMLSLATSHKMTGADADDDWLCTPHRNKWKGEKWQGKTKKQQKNY